MKVNYNGKANKGGVYRILNTSNGRFYYGSAQEFKGRKKSHQTRLRNNRHENAFLQNDFNKCGGNVFIFEVVEVVENIKQDRWDREQHYLDLYYDNQQLCYNLDKTAHKGTRTKFSNTPEETKDILSRKAKAMWKDPATRKKILKRKNEAMKTPEYKKALKEGLERAWDNEERRDAASERMKERHESGTMEDAVETLKKAQPKGRKTFKKRMKEDAEFKKKYQEIGRRNIAKRNAEQPKKKYRPLISPDGKAYEVCGVPTFCKEHGLTKQLLYNVLNGKSKSHMGWQLFTK